MLSRTKRFLLKLEHYYNDDPSFNSVNFSDKDMKRFPAQLTLVPYPRFFLRYFPFRLDLKQPLFHQVPV